MPALLGPPPRTAPWLPEAARNAEQVVLLVLDGLGWDQLRDRAAHAPTLASMAGGPITSVAPTTTATALCSIVLGMRPCEHGVVGYRMRVAVDGADRVLNVLRWRTSDGDAREAVPPASVQPHEAFAGRDVAVVTRGQFASTGFTTLLGVKRLAGWTESSSIAVEVGTRLRAGDPFVYAYYDGIDKIAHERGFGPHYDAELRAADRIVADVAAALPPGAALVVTADHGQVEVGDRAVVLESAVLDAVAFTSGENRFLWLHAKPGGDVAALADRCRAEFEAPGLAWVRTRDEVVDGGWYGGPLAPEAAARLGDVALVAREPVAFFDPSDLGSIGLRCRHGSLTAAELRVPLVAVGSGDV
ncbi:MAG: hypothetical protein QOF60_741 [Actinomycetota bacterium]|nr:hypothetical protein [Actinomycetota bacterium]